MPITIGQTGEVTMTVTAQDTAAALGSGTVPVFATPRMIALMEQAAWTAIQNELEEGQTTVGISMAVTHDAATPVGMEVTAQAEVTAVEGRTITFRVNAFDQSGSIGQGSHQRAVVREEKFVQRCEQKLSGK